MKAIYVSKSDINEGLRSGTVTKAAIVFFEDVFFTIPYSSTNILGGDEIKFNGREVFNNAKLLINEGKHTEAYDYLTQAMPDDNTYYLRMLDILNVKVGWWIFGGFYFRKRGGMRKAASISSKVKRQEIKDLLGNNII
ncbi:MAG: hypothetical protein CVU11_06385 [Bacteroidetes bacterium HGW-Bacteroidetes-6]|jgi:hypothetical protein|nr:MAG: hypothetical protein CVU11_06385 [Bacteroidetes bacterium HGW-Bacteroidetes-6]